jgi:hypothetical protein
MNILILPSSLAMSPSPVVHDKAISYKDICHAILILKRCENEHGSKKAEKIGIDKMPLWPHEHRRESKKA